MTDPKGEERLPDWTRDELILALDLYRRTRDAMGYGKTTQVVVELSDELRLLGLFADNVRLNPRFRNSSGVAMKLHNFESIDPNHPGAAMPHGSRMDQVVWDEWAHRPDELAVVAAAIRSTEGTSIVQGETGEAEEYEAEEGRLLYRLHRRYERDPKLVKAKKNVVRKATGRLACEVCDFESSEAYGEGIEVIDVHHIKPLHTIGASTTKLADLALLCPTCHRVVHAHKPFVTPVELRSLRDSS